MVGIRRTLCKERAQAVLEGYEKERLPVKPPVPIHRIAEWMKFTVVLLYSVGDEFSGLVSPKQSLIGINGNHHRHRQRFSLAHELAHIILKHPPESHCSAAEIRIFNAEADLCASELLMPERILLRLHGRRLTPPVLAMLFDVSEQAVAMRAAVELSPEYVRIARV